MEGVFGIWHFILFFVILTTIFKKEELKELIKIQVYIAFFYSILALLILFNLGPISPITTSNRLSGLTGNPSYFATYALMNAFFALYFYFEEYLFNKKIFNKWLALSIFFAFLMFVTGCRGTMIALGLTGLGIWFLVNLNKSQEILVLKRSLNLIVFISLIFVLIIFAFKDKPFIKNYFALERLASVSLKDPTAVSRIYSAKTAFKGFLERPIFGWGPENYQTPYIKYFNPIVVRYLPSDFFFDRAHNKPMEVLATTGIVGFISYIAIFLFAFYLLYDSYKKNKNLFLTNLALAGGLFGYFVQNIFIFDFHESYLMAFLLLAFINSFYEKEIKISSQKEKSIVNFSDYSKDLLKMFLIVLSFCLVLYSFVFFLVKPYLVSLNIIRGMRELKLDHPDEALKILKKILKDPTFLKEDIIIGYSKIIDISKNEITNKEKLLEIIDLLINEANSLLEKHPERFLVLANKTYLEELAFELGDAKKYELAENSFKKIIEIAPYFPQPRISYVKLLLMKNKIDEALNEINSILEIYPNSAEANYLLYQLLKQKKEGEKAIPYLIKALENNLKVISKNLAVALVKEIVPLKRYDLIEKLYLQAINLDPKDYTLYISLAATYGKLHNKEKAIEYAKKVLELKPEAKQAVEDFINIIQNEEWDKIPD